jgi:predicted metalloprotease
MRVKTPNSLQQFQEVPMRLDGQRESSNVEDDRSGGSSSSFGGGGSSIAGGGIGMLLPLLIRGIGLKGVIILAVVYFALKFTTGIDLINIVNGGGGGISIPETAQIEPQATTAGSLNGNNGTGADVTGDAGKQFVSKVLASTEDVWGSVFQSMGKQYRQPKLVLFSGYIQSACGTAQSASGPFYCPADQKVYIDLSFYQDMKTKLGAPGDFAQAYVVAHEVGHHVQNELGIADQVDQARKNGTEVEANALSVKLELQADCLAGIWATAADASKHILESGDIEEALNAASQIGDDKLQKQSQGYVVPDSFTHGTSAQRVRWFKAGLVAKTLSDCDTFSASRL